MTLPLLRTNFNSQNRVGTPLLPLRFVDSGKGMAACFNASRLPQWRRERPWPHIRVMQHYSRRR